ncbi:MAG TPA: TMEM175 family protein [Streptosporangiaceae bacterium]|nr:TMEM175 family protein [Streptosporangiaceae bacterium]
MSEPPRSAARRERDDLPSVDRLLTLSDGVVAIALTLLVLQLHVPAIGTLSNANSPSELATQLGKDGDQLISYVISFYIIANFWLVHHRVFTQLAGQREDLAWLNFAFLFTITIMPFASDLIGQYGENPLAVTVFAMNLLLASLATQATLELGRRRGLMVQHADLRARRAGRVRAVSSGAIILVSIAVAWVNTDIAKYLWLLIALVPRLAIFVLDRREDAASPPG